MGAKELSRPRRNVFSEVPPDSPTARGLRKKKVHFRRLLAPVRETKGARLAWAPPDRATAVGDAWFCRPIPGSGGDGLGRQEAEPLTLIASSLISVSNGAGLQ